MPLTLTTQLRRHRSGKLTSQVLGLGQSEIQMLDKIPPL